jgi:hypothetical protein
MPDVWRATGSIGVVVWAMAPPATANTAHAKTQLRCNVLDIRFTPRMIWDRLSNRVLVQSQDGNTVGGKKFPPILKQ